MAPATVKALLSSDATSLPLPAWAADPDDNVLLDRLAALDASGFFNGKHT
jgi:hypothetical protein